MFETVREVRNVDWPYEMMFADYCCIFAVRSDAGQMDVPQMQVREPGDHLQRELSLSEIETHTAHHDRFGAYRCSANLTDLSGTRPTSSLGSIRRNQTEILH